VLIVPLKVVVEVDVGPVCVGVDEVACVVVAPGI